MGKTYIGRIEFIRVFTIKELARTGLPDEDSLPVCNIPVEMHSQKIYILPTVNYFNWSK